MPLFHFCSTAGCGSKIPYLTEKPKECPKCKTKIEDPSKIIVKAVIIEVEDLPVIHPVARSSRSTPIVRKEKISLIKKRAQDSSLEPEENDEEDNTLEEEEEESYDPKVVKRLARQLAASIDPSTIRVNDEDQNSDIINMKDWCKGAPDLNV